MGKKKKVKLNCKQCEEVFEVTLSRADIARFCSKKCYGLWWSENFCGKDHPSWKEKVKKICEWCKTGFEVKPSLADQKFCSRKCMGLAQSQNRCGENSLYWKGRVKKICGWCEKEFGVISSRADKAKFCSNKCKDQWISERFSGKSHPQWKGGRVKLVCEQCKEEFDEWLFRKDTARFCSNRCKYLWMSENLGGENNPCWKEKIKLNCKQCGIEFGVEPYLADRKKFCSQECRGLWQSENWCGENNHNWQGGTSFEPYGPNWTEELKEQIRKRDEYTCAISGEVWQPDQPTFHVHHIDTDKKNCERDNLITLTGSSHIHAHANRRHWQPLLAHIAKGAEMQANAFIKLGGRE